MQNLVDILQSGLDLLDLGKTGLGDLTQFQPWWYIGDWIRNAQYC